ncbi:BQ2448_7168 [Microbotryum intermedium]|uniref:BQ2448_7168 protein n=1 Tax=Microbotryum intermedium TaxID=269621 RepID=A0A238FMK1_9BASI|nr:BQ2448_7168 [Microbotryum intermedium]
MLVSNSVATAILLVTSFSLVSALHHDDTSHPSHGAYKFRLARRTQSFTEDGMFNKEALVRENIRISHKYAKAAKNSLINLSVKSKAAEVRHREKVMFEAAQAIERQSLDEAKHLARRHKHSEPSRGHVPLTDVDFSDGYDAAYAGSVSFGTPFQQLAIDFDTGSGDTWVLGSHTLTKYPHTKYNPQLSSTFIESAGPTKWDEEYGSGSLEGLYMQDRVSVGGYEIPEQRFGVATKTLPILDGLKIDGVMGLAFPACSTMHVPSFMENLLRGKGNHPLPIPVLFNGSLNYLPVTEKALWQVACEGVVVDDKLLEGTKMVVALDTGSAMIRVPSSVANKIFKNLHGKLQKDGSFTIPCKSPCLKSFRFALGGQTYKIPLSDLNMGVYDKSDPSQCTFGIFVDDGILGSDGKPMAILGDTFLKTVYAVFHYSKNNRAAIGLAPVVEHAK